MTLPLLVLVGCGNDPGPGAAGRTPSPHPSAGHSGSAVPSPLPSPSATGTPSTATVDMKRPGRFVPPLLTPDILVYSSHTLKPGMVKRIRKVAGVGAVEQFSMAQFYYHENEVNYAAVDPKTFRNWTLGPSAQSNALWNRVADGEIAVRPKLGHRIENAHDYVHLGNAAKAPTVHVGAYAQLISPIYSRQIDAVVNRRWVRPLGMVPGNAMLVSTGTAQPDGKMVRQLRAITGNASSVQILSPHFDVHDVQTAILTGSSVSSAVGTFNYTANANGTVNLPSSWVGQHITTEQVPILGSVTCNRVMLPQLVDALHDIQQRGLAKYINPGQYGGCFVPRYIAGTHTLSYHAFGLAIDLNVPENERGTRGQMNRQVVQIFQKWGFEWGGTWHYTDPMHFELHRIVKAG
ncbi:MAG: M15 family metallopeptidase [Marmoricola sp.]